MQSCSSSNQNHPNLHLHENHSICFK